MKQQEPLRATTPQLVAYALPAFGIEFIIVPILVVLPSYYAARAAGTMTAFGTAIFISRIVYSCSGPIVGYFSDRWWTPWGHRKPWMLAGAIIAAIASLLLFVPPKTAGVLYFGLASALGLFAFSVIDVPYIAWGAEISRNYDMRSRITTYRAALGVLAQVAFFGLPLVLPGFGGTYVLQTTVLNRLGYVAVFTIIVVVLVALIFGPQSAAEPARIESLSLGRIVRAMLFNTPMRWFSAALMLTFLLNTIQATVTIPFLTSLGIERWYQLTVIASLAAGIVGLPLWLWITYRIGKVRSWTLGLIITALSAPLFYAVKWASGPLSAVFVSTIVAALPAAFVLGSLTYSVMADVIDHDEVKTGENHAANYSAVTLLLIRIQSALGGSLAFYVLAAFKYRIGAPNTSVANAGLHFDYLILPALLALAGAACIWRFPLDAKTARPLASAAVET